MFRLCYSQPPFGTDYLAGTYYYCNTPAKHFYPAFIVVSGCLAKALRRTSAVDGNT